MMAKNAMYFILLGCIVLSSFGTGCGDGECLGNGKHSWSNGNNPVTSTPATAFYLCFFTSPNNGKATLTTNGVTDPDGDVIEYEWNTSTVPPIYSGIQSSDVTSTTLDPCQSAVSCNTTYFHTDTNIEYCVKVRAADTMGCHTIEAPVYIKVTCVSPASIQNGAQASSQQTIYGTNQCSACQNQGNAPAFDVGKALSDPLTDKYYLCILVIGPDDRGVLNKPITIKDDYTWEQEIAIGGPEDIGKRFILNLVLIDRYRLSEFENISGYSFKQPPITIESVKEFISKLRESDVGREIFDDTFQRVEVIRGR